MLTIVVAILVLDFGYFVGGTVGNYFFKRTPSGRVLVSAVAVMLGAILFYVTLNIPLESFELFLVMHTATALFIPFAAPNVTSTVFDITLPEVRSTAAAIQYFIESSGAALAPLMVGMIAVNSSFKNAFLVICISTWIVCSIIFGLVALIIPRDIASLREQMRQRADALGSGGG
jgi:MFS family permease